MWRRWIPAGQRVLDHLETLRQPTIAAINGFAFGGGLELALACDLRIAADHATFAAPEVGIATVPGWGATGRLAAVVGLARAKQLILTGQPIDAATAATWGLVGDVVPTAGFADATHALAMQIAGQAPVAVQVAKQLIDGQRPRPAVALEALGGGLTAFTADAEEGRAGLPRTPATHVRRLLMAETLPTTTPVGTLPDGFAPMAERALDFAARQVEALVRTKPDMFPIFTVGGRWQVEENAWTNWTRGLPRRAALDRRPAHGRRLVAGAGGALQPADRASGASTGRSTTSASCSSRPGSGGTTSTATRRSSSA